MKKGSISLFWEISSARFLQKSVHVCNKGRRSEENSGKTEKIPDDGNYSYEQKDQNNQNNQCNQNISDIQTHICRFVTEMDIL